jgi:hypothetical protein
MARLGPAQAEAARAVASVGTTVDNLPSERSAAWFIDIMERRQLPDKDGVSGEERARRALQLIKADALTQRQVSKAIDEFKSCPLKPATPVSEEPSLDPVAAAMDSVPSGYYAVKEPKTGELRFFRLKQGRKSGVYWIHLQHGPEETELYPNHANAIMRGIMRDPAGAMRLYGRHIGCCGKCGARLTNRISRLLDIGPVCGGHFYDPEIWRAMQRAAREALKRAGLDPDVDVEDTDDLDKVREAARL